jgi:glycosyltransferase involved in cell wall biosynthesis
VNALFLTKYGRAGASSRYRIYAYLSHLRTRGWQADVYPLLRDTYVDEMYTIGRRSVAGVAGATWRRAVTLLRPALRQYDVVYIQYELFPYIPFLLEKLFYRWNRSRVIVDYDDATFAMYEQIPVLKNKIASVMREARIVVTGNRCLKEYARRYAKEVITIPTVIELGRYGLKPDHGTDGRPPVIGWIGTPVTVRNLAGTAEAFQRAAACVDYTLRCVGAPPGFAIPGVKSEVRPWSEDTEAEEIRQFDVGVMPLMPSLFAGGKCGFKLIQYMGCGVPPVATAIGANCDIIHDGVNGFLASSQAEFAEKLCTLLADVALRRRLGRAARETVREQYCLEVTAPLFCDLLDRVAKDSSTSCATEGRTTVMDPARLSSCGETKC